MTDRIADIRQTFARKGLDGFVVSSLAHVRYLTNFSGSSAALLILPNALHFFTDGRYAEQIKTELYALDGFCAHITREPWKYAAQNGLLGDARALGFEATKLSYAAACALRRALKPARLKPCAGIVEKTTIVKTAEEVEYIRRAADIAADVFEYILGFVAPGMKEADVAAEISYQAKKRGSEEDAFEIIVASGARGALPHGRASDKTLRAGELVTLDFGCRVNGFHSDLTRTFALGQPSDFDRSVYDLVLEANTRAVAAARAGITAKRLDAVARDFIEQAGYGKNFDHGLGHGLGIEVHEAPGVSYRFPRLRIPEGAVITIEPGIYVPGRCGARVEDDVWVRANGCEVLTTKATKRLLCV